MLSFAEWVPKRPPRAQKLPLASGTWKFEITIGCASIVTSTNQAICCGSSHSLRICSSTTMTMSRSAPSASLANSGNRHFRHREGGMRAVERRHFQPPDFRIAQILRRRLLGAVEQLVAIDDLHDAALVGAVTEIDAVRPAARARSRRAVRSASARWRRAPGRAGRNRGFSPDAPDRSCPRLRSCAAPASPARRRRDRRCRYRIPKSSYGCR